MKIAFVHDYIKEYGGAERVLETLHEMYPNSPVYTLVYCPQFLGPHRQRFKNWDIRESWVGWIPLKHKFISIFRLLAPWVFRSFDLSGYDVVIVSSTGAYIPNAIETKNKKIEHICYCHTPPRYLYGYATAREWKKNIIFRVLAEISNHILRMVDFKAAQSVDIFIANSNEVAQRIKKFYRRDSIVIYPPALKEVFGMKYIVSSKKSQNTKYYLAGGRLARPKHVDLIISACAEMGLSLKIFGKGFAGYEEELKSQI